MSKDDRIKVLKDMAGFQIKGIDEGGISASMKSISKANVMLQLHEDITKVLMEENTMICSQKYMTYMLRKEYENEKLSSREYNHEAKYMSFEEWLEKNDLNESTSASKGFIPIPQQLPDLDKD